MEELVAKIFGKLSINKQDVQKDENLSPEQKVKIISAIDEKMKEVLEARLIGYEALRVLYFNKNSNNVKDIDLHESVEIKIIQAIATAIKNNATNEELKAEIKNNLNTPEEQARFFIEKDLRNEFDHSTISYETIKQVFPITSPDSDKVYKVFDWTENLERIIYEEVLIDADAFIEAMKTMQNMVVDYIREQSTGINL